MELPFVSRKKYDDVVYKLECLLCNATGGKLSKHTYTWQTMVSAVMDYIQDCCNEYVKESNSEVERLEKALAAKDAEYDQALHDKAREFNMVIDKICLEHRAKLALLHNSHEQELAEAKREVAREIFEELYKSVVSKIPPHIRPIFKDDMDFEDGFRNGKTDALLDVLALIAELKKKYTEDQT